MARDAEAECEDMTLWPSKYLPEYGARCEHCGQNMVKPGNDYVCIYAVCPVGRGNHEKFIEKRT